MRSVLVFVLAAVVLAPAAAGEDPGGKAAKRAAGTNELIAFAESLLLKDARQAFSTDHFDVVTDGPAGNTASVLASNFEAVFRVLGDMFPASRGTSAERAGKVRTYLFRSRRQYAAFEAFVGGGRTGRSAGMYFPEYGILAFHLEMVVQPAVKAVMIHECVHAFVDRMLRADYQSFSSCFGEGLAEYVGVSEIVDGRIQVGSYRKKTSYDYQGRTYVVPSIAAVNLSTAQRAARRRKQTLSFDYLFRTSANSIKDEHRRDEFYSVSWLLVDFLGHGRPEWHDRKFPTYLARVASGKPPREVLEEVYGLPAAELERSFREYVKNLKLPLRRPLPLFP